MRMAFLMDNIRNIDQLYTYTSEHCLIWRSVDILEHGLCPSCATYIDKQ